MPKNSQIRGVNMDLFDNDVLGTSNVRMTPDFPAVKKSWKSLRTWYIILPIVLMVLTLGFLFIQQDILYAITDKIVPIYTSMVGGATAEADEALDVATASSTSTGLGHEADVDSEHRCLCCGVVIACKDVAPADHICDYPSCGKDLGPCTDKAKDHYCDVCGNEIAPCEDADYDHKCDYGCSVVFGGACADDDNNHFCDYCHKKTACVDADKDHYCDICDSYMTCKDANNDHKCDYGCTKTLGTCADVNKDHKCDYGCSKVFGSCADADKDHKCDYGCGKYFDAHVDTNNDHKCDYCDFAFFACRDSDKDHKCDFGCSKYIGSHIDTDDHKCDYCNEAMSECYDNNADFACDLCGAPVYPVWIGLAIIAVPFILIELICLIVWFAKKSRLSRISIEFYKDIIVYRDGRDVLMRTFHGSYTASVRQDTLKERRGNYGTVTIYCPGGPAMSMVFSRIENPHGLVAQLRASRPKESVGISTIAPDADV